MQKKLPLRRRIYTGTMRALMYLSAGLTAALVLFLIGYVLLKGVPNISWELLSTAPSYLEERIGILPDILNTLYLVMATILFVLPLGVCAAIYLNEYASNKKLVAAIEYAAETLSGMMARNVSEVYGSGRFPNMDICAKSGTAERENGPADAMFAGFVEDEAYPLAFVVFAERGGSGSQTAAPIAAKVLAACKTMLDTPNPNG